MKNKSRLKTSIITLGIVFAFLSINNFNIIDIQGNNDEVIEIRGKTNLKSSGYWNLQFIHVDGNWSHTAGNYTWCSGDGSWSNPYTIENVTIDASTSPTGSGIFINNSKNDYFIIRNCTVYNSGGGLYDGGIKLENTSNGAVINNNCSDNGAWGIFLFNSCNNNTVSGNTANNNMQCGIHLYVDCIKNIISGNIANENAIDGIWLRDHSDYNIISRNTVNNNTERGVTISLYCVNNNISGNTANNNNYYGILLSNYCNNNTISNNIANENNPGGIHLWNYCDNNTVLGNNINDNDEYGIYLYRSSINTISGNAASDNSVYGIWLRENCDNNTLSGNLIKGNQIYGIYIFSSDCQNNLIYQNSLIGTIDWHARDEGTNNHWNASIIGNYWDNHTSPDSDNDGIVDISYTWIAGGAGRVDNFPLRYSPVFFANEIHIDDSGVSAPTWSRTAELNLWCTGTGTHSDPYIIDGLEIDAGGSGSCIVIENSENNYFIIRNCTTYNAVNGIILENTDNGTLTINSCTSNSRGIWLYDNCKNNTISNNIADRNSGVGIILQLNCDNNTLSGNRAYGPIQNRGIRLINGCDNNTVSGNTVNNNDDYGIWIQDNCNYNTISGNTANNNDYGIKIYSSNNTIISGNTVNNNRWHGIYLENDCEDNSILGNTANNNFYYGIQLLADCDSNTISGNTADDNGHSGIYLGDYCDDNTISGNFADDNRYYGIFFLNGCDNNTISGNTANINFYGIFIYDHCNNNTISGNTLNNNYYGICLMNSNKAKLSGNTMKKCGVMVYGSFNQLASHMIYPNNTVNGRSLYYYVNKSGLDAANFSGGGQVLLFYCNNSVISNLNVSHTSIGIYLYRCNNITISNNTINNNTQYGIILVDNCDKNIILGNYIYFNSEGAIYISSTNCDDNIIERNILVSNNGKFIDDSGTNTIIILNCISNTPPSFLIEIIAQSFSTMEFIVTLKISCEITGFEVSDLSIQIWWDGTNVPLNNITKLGIGLYNVLLTPTFVTPGEDPILLNMTISAACHSDKYFEMYISVEPCEILKFLQVEISDHSYSLEYFNFTFFVFDETGQGVGSSTIQMWWNGIDVSNNVSNLGNGFYFVSLEPITVIPGEDPILLTMTISAEGYEDKYFETYFAVDPDTLVKELVEPAEEFPLVIILIAIISTSTGIGVAMVVIYLLRKRRRVSEVI